MRTVVRSAAGIAMSVVIAGMTCSAAAQPRPADYPKKPIRLLAPVAPGGGLDIITRAAAQVLTEKFGQTVIVDNRPGGGTVIAMEYPEVERQVRQTTLLPSTMQLSTYSLSFI